MTFFEVLTQVIGLLVLQGRMSYRALQLQFALDETHLEALKVELIEVHKCAVDVGGTVLVWAGAAPVLPFTEAVHHVPPTSSAPVHRAPEAERRQVTVLFCDLVDSTRLAQQLDPEDYRGVVRAYQAVAVDVIQPFDGYVAQYLGDGLMLYFGWPQAHEDAAARAVYASLAMLAAMGALNARLAAQYGVQVAVRLGLHTGLAVIGQMGSGARQEQLAMGDTPNIAARLQGLAAPNTVLLSATTAHLVQSVFVLEDVGTHALKGVAEPMPVWRVLGAREADHSEADTMDGQAPFLVGRDEEVGLLRRRWEQSKAGLGQVVLLSGEAGIGKSTLVAALRAHVGRERSRRLALRCSPYHTNSALYPIIEHVQRWLGLQPDDRPETKLERLEQGLRPSRLPLEEGVPLLAALLSVPLPERYPPLRLTPPQQKQQTLDALVAWLLEEAERQPVLAVWEDLHWADPSTLELLGLLIDQAPTVPMLHVLTFRPAFVPLWPNRSHLTPITLNRLERPQVEALIAHQAGGKALPAEVVRHIVVKTDGVPLFVEELTKMLLESGVLRAEADHYALTGPLSTVTIPATLQDSLMARLDRLPTAREVAQLGAVLGREFAYDVLRAVSPLDEPTVQARLAQLVAAELLYQRGRPPRATYIFKHALIQDAAYASLLKSTRQHYHQQIAQLFETRYAEAVATQPELLAHHYTAAGCPAQAATYWQQAGQRALERSATLEAVSHVTQGLEVLQALPESRERAQQELALHLTLGPALMATKGPTDAEVERIYARARQLCQQIGETPQLFPALGGLHRFYFGRGELQTARELGEQFLRLAGRQEDPALRLTGHWLLGTPLVWLGEVATAQAHFEQSTALYDPPQHRGLAFRYGMDPGSASQGYMAFTLWVLGYPDQALQWSQQALTLAQEVAHPFSTAYVLFIVATLHALRREGQAAYDRTEAVLALSTEHGFPLWILLGTFMREYALVMLGQGEEGIAQMRQHQEAWRATVMGPVYLLLLAETYGKTGQPETGLMVLAETRDAMEATGHRLWEAEAYRLQGEFLLARPDANLLEAEICFRQALDTARHQRTRAWELRAAMSLARLWQRQSKREEAGELLAAVYGWFTEGFDTADLQEAKALLEELGGNPS